MQSYICTSNLVCQLYNKIVSQAFIAFLYLCQVSTLLRETHLLVIIIFQNHPTHAEQLAIFCSKTRT